MSMNHKSPELQITITFRIPMSELPRVGEQVAPIVNAVTEMGGKRVHLEILDAPTFPFR